MSQIVEPAPSTRREQQKEAKRLALIDAALAVFSRVGYAAAKIDDVAEEAGVSKGTVYLYFESKEALFEAMVKAKMVPMLDDVAEAASSSGHLVADRFTIADLTAASILYPLFMPEGTTGAELVKSDPTGQHWLKRWADHPAGAYVKATYSKFRTAKLHS